MRKRWRLYSSVARPAPGLRTGRAASGGALKKLAANLIALAAGLAGGVLVLELALRLAGFGPAFVTADRTLGYRYIPGASYRWIAEGGSSGRINRAGWRDVDHTEAKPRGVTRILLLGDSFTAAMQVPLDSTYFRCLERLLNAGAVPGRRFEVIAMGEDGNGTTAEYLTYRDWGRRWKPDIVAVLFVGNDAADNWKPAALDQTRPFFFDDGDSLRLDLSFAASPGFRRYERWRWLKAHSALWALAHRAMGALQAARGVRPGGVGLETRIGPTERVNDGYFRDWNYDARLPADSIPSFRLTEKILARLAADVQRDHGRFVVFAAGFAFQEDRRLLAQCRLDPNFDPEKPVRWLLSVGERHGFEVAPLTPAFRAASAALDRPLWFGPYGRYGHWNATGHAVAARAMAEYLQTTSGPSRSRVTP